MLLLANPGKETSLFSYAEILKEVLIEVFSLNNFRIYQISQSLILNHTRKVQEYICKACLCWKTVSYYLIITFIFIIIKVHR